MGASLLALAKSTYYTTCTVDAIPSISWFASTREGKLRVGAVCIIVTVM